MALKEVGVRLKRLPRALQGTTIVQLTDVHVGPTIRRGFVEEIVARTNALAPDLVVITGDLVDGSVEELREHVAPLANLRARYGVFFVTGNHEYYSGAEEWCEELPRLGIRVLRNERVVIGEGKDSFDLAGIDDAHAYQYGNGHGAELERAVAGRDPERELVLLAHQPKALFGAVKHGVGLQLSGHTHGGQLWPWKYLVRPAATGGRGARSLRGHPGVRELRHRLLGTADAARGARGNYAYYVALGVRRAATAWATRMPSSAALTMPPA